MRGQTLGTAVSLLLPLAQDYEPYNQVQHTAPVLPWLLYATNDVGVAVAWCIRPGSHAVCGAST